MSQRGLTEEVIKQIVEDYRRGASIRAIHRKTGLPIYLIYYALGKAGVEPKTIRRAAARNVTKVKPLGRSLTCRTVIPSFIIRQLDLKPEGGLMAEWSILDKESGTLKVRLFKPE